MSIANLSFHGARSFFDSQPSPPGEGICLAPYGGYGARVGWRRTLSATNWMKDFPFCWQVAAIEASTCQARAPLEVLFPQEIFRAMTAGRNWRSARLLVAGTSDRSKKVNR